LFNYHRVVGAQHLVIVEGYWSVFRLHALNVPAVALMGTSLSDLQMDLLGQSGAQRLELPRFRGRLWIWASGG
jgi:DNA primase